MCFTVSRWNGVLKMNLPKQNNQKALGFSDLNRRQLMSGGMAGVAGLSLRALATGLPMGFLLSGAMPAHAIGQRTKSLILAMSSDGESINCSHPGSFPTRGNDPRSAIQRPRGGGGSINGNAVTAADFANSAEIRMGDTTIQAPRFWRNVSQELLDRLNFFNLRTNANGHVESGSVFKIHGALLGLGGRGVEDIQSAIFQALLDEDSSVNTVLQAPMVLTGGGNTRLFALFQQGVPLNRYTPVDIQELFLSGNGQAIDRMNDLYDSTIDAVYKDISASGTPEQKRFLDNYAASREQASSLGDKLGDLLSGINGSSKEDQARASVALTAANVSPVVVLRYQFSGDNHGSTDGEVRDTCIQIDEMQLIHDLLKSQGIEDRVNYATFDVFGRHLAHNGRGGRDHHNGHSTGILLGSNIKAGVTGGYETWNNSGNKRLRATGINSSNGTSNNPDINGSETLAAYARTLMSSVGISEEGIDERLPASRTVRGALK